MRRRFRAQAMAEFVLILPIMLMIAFTTLDLYEFISIRGRIFDIAAASLEAATAAKLPDPDFRFTPGASADPELHRAQQAFLCAQLYSQMVGLAKADDLPRADEMELESGDCSADPSPLAISVIGLSSLGADADIADLENQPNDVTGLPQPYTQRPSTYSPTGTKPLAIRVCVQYQWTPRVGVFYYATGGIGGIRSETVNSLFTWQFCGRTALDPRRSY